MRDVWKKRILSLALTAAMVLGAGAPALAAETPDQEIIILYTNDVHCGVTDNIGYAGLALYEKQMKEETPYVALVGENEAGQTALMQILAGELEPDAGSFKWGVSTSQSYFPQDNSAFFDGFEGNLIEWLRQYSPDPTETFLRGFLGRMLFSGDEVYKPASVLSGGEKVRCMLSRMMMSHSNVLVLDQPTNHLDLESIQALSNGLASFKGNLLFSSHDHQFIDEIANRIIEIPLGQEGCLDRTGSFEEFLAWKKERGL